MAYTQYPPAATPASYGDSTTPPVAPARYGYFPPPPPPPPAPTAAPDCYGYVCNQSNTLVTVVLPPATSPFTTAVVAPETVPDSAVCTGSENCSPQSQGLPTGQVIAISVVLGLVALGLIAYLFWRLKSKKAKDGEKKPDEPEAAAGT